MRAAGSTSMSKSAGDRATTSALAKLQAEERVIMRAAFRLIGQSDSGSTSVQDILAATGLSTRAFYRHFESKDELIMAMYRVDSKRAAAELSTTIAKAPTPLRAVEAWIDHWLSIAFDPRRAARVRVLSSNEVRASAGFRLVTQEYHLISVAVLTQILSSGKEQGLFPRIQPDEDAASLQRIMLGYVEARVFREFTPPWAEARAYVCELFSRMSGVSVDP